MKTVAVVGSSGFDPWTGRERKATSPGAQAPFLSLAKYPSAVPSDRHGLRLNHLLNRRDGALIGQLRHGRLQCQGRSCGYSDV